MLKTWNGALARSVKGSLPIPPAILESAPKHMFGLGRGHQVAQRSLGTLHKGSNLARGSPMRPNFFTASRGPQTRQTRGFRFSSWRGSKGNTTGHTTGSAGAEEAQSLSAKFKKLTREYGRAAVVVYFLLSVLDYPFFFLLVKAVGTERVGKAEAYIVSIASTVVPESIRVKTTQTWELLRGLIKGKQEDTDEIMGQMDNLVVEGEKGMQEASLGTQLALAYAIHKSFFFIRIPLTIAVTPKIVKRLRSWGWNIGKQVNKSK